MLLLASGSLWSAGCGRVEHKTTYMRIGDGCMVGSTHTPRASHEFAGDVAADLWSDTGDHQSSCSNTMPGWEWPWTPQQLLLFHIYPPDLQPARQHTKHMPRQRVPGESYFQQKNLWWTVSIARHSMVVGAPLAVCGLLLGDHGAYGHQLGSPRYDGLSKIYKS